MNVLGRTHSCVISYTELFLAWPQVLNLVYLGAQETDCVCHLSENMGQVVNNFTIEFWAMHPKVSLPNTFY